MSSISSKCWTKFQSTPSSRRETRGIKQVPKPSKFQSTPSSRRETYCSIDGKTHAIISIHSLLAEGDACGHGIIGTYSISIHSLLAEGDGAGGTNGGNGNDFNPLPPRGGRPPRRRLIFPTRHISIHSLLAEGDPAALDAPDKASGFQSTPSSRRETPEVTRAREEQNDISIHSLLAEGDRVAAGGLVRTDVISIHSLLAEGDGRRPSGMREGLNFNPLPPRGGRLILAARHKKGKLISIHSLLAEGDRDKRTVSNFFIHFNPLPPRGGRQESTRYCNYGNAFQSTPSSRRETEDRTALEHVIVKFQSTPSSRRETPKRSSAPTPNLFQSTPSSRRETCRVFLRPLSRRISIHSLLAEGD